MLGSLGWPIFPCIFSDVGCPLAKAVGKPASNVTNEKNGKVSKFKEDLTSIVPEPTRLESHRKPNSFTTNLSKAFKIPPKDLGKVL